MGRRASRPQICLWPSRFAPRCPAWLSLGKGTDGFLVMLKVQVALRGVSRSEKCCFGKSPAAPRCVFPSQILRGLKQHPEHGHQTPKRGNLWLPQPPCLRSHDSERPRGSPFLLSMPSLPRNGGGGPVLGPHHSGNPKQGAASDNPHQPLALFLLQVGVFLAAGSLGL